jgi:hypothetical protein
MRKIFPKAEVRSRELVEIFADVAAATSVGCKIRVASAGGVREMDCPTINYTFGSAQYIKDRLDELSRTVKGNEMKFPLIALFVPATEVRGKDAAVYATTRVRVLIACSSRQQWSNEERRYHSFENILRPIYRRFIEALKEDGRFDFGGDGCVPHEYSENYSYGRYGAHTAAGDSVSEPIDAVNISNLELIIKPQNCR